MKNIIISLSLFVVSVKASDYCWAEEAGYPCCPDGYDIVEVEEVWGKWGIYNGMWCGILDKRDRCWAQAIAEDYKFCKYGTEILESNMDGDWGWDDENSTLCGMRNSPQRWNDRELVEETREEWEKFKLDWDNELKYDFTRLSVFVGEDESKLNFGWYSTQPETPTICWGSTESLDNCKIFKGTVQKYYILKGTQYYSNKVTVTGIERNSVYYYARVMDGEMDEVHSFKTYDEENFNFIFVGDPQIGGSYGRITSSNNYERLLNEEEGTRNDAFNWNRTVYNSMEFARTPSVFLSAGDQAEEQDFFFNTIESFISDNEDAFFTQETQYSAFLLPEKLKTIPVAAAVGNHDSYNENFRHHFNTPNPYMTTSNEFDNNYIIPGYNYFFKYNNVLVVVLESNYGTCMDFINVVEKAISTYPDVDWHIALFHHDIYGNGEYHSSEYHIVSELRPCLTGLLYAYGFDLAINGHDHFYSASKFIIYNSLDVYHTSEEIKSNEVYRNPPGTLYVTANCSTGSKLYGPLYYEPDYINYYNQSYTSTFGTIDFQKENGKVRLTVTTYEVEGYRVIDGPYIIEKDAKSKCWANKYGYECCKEGTLATKLDKDGRYWSNAEGAGEDDLCGVIIDPKEKCWSKPFGIDCCQSNTATYKTDENGSWGIEIKDGKSVMCGIEEKITEDECWGRPLGYRCCKIDAEVHATTKQGQWGKDIDENGNEIWCTIPKVKSGVILPPPSNVDILSIPPPPKAYIDCWTTEQGYKCCPEETSPIYADKNGFRWGFLNNSEWCGIIEQEESLDITTVDFTDIEIETEIINITDAIEIEMEIEAEIETGINTNTESFIKSSIPTKISTTIDDTETLYPIEIETITDFIETETETETVFITVTDIISEASPTSTITTNSATITTDMNSISETITTTKSLPTNCWATALGFPCCTDPKAQTYFIDDNGYWGVENNDWCGKIVSDNS